MKTFKQLMEELPPPVTPKQLDVVKSDFRFIRTPDVITKENIKFRKGTGFNLPLPLAKKKNNKKVQTA